MTASRILAGLAGLALSVVVLGVSCAHRHAPTEQGRAAACARRLHIHYTPEDGATERLAAFSACVGGGR